MEGAWGTGVDSSLSPEILLYLLLFLCAHTPSLFSSKHVLCVCVYYTHIILHWRECTLERLTTDFFSFSFSLSLSRKERNQFLTAILNSSLFSHCHACSLTYKWFSSNTWDPPSVEGGRPTTAVYAWKLKLPPGSCWHV